MVIFHSYVSLPEGKAYWDFLGSHWKSAPPTEAEFMGFWDQVRSGSMGLWVAGSYPGIIEFTLWWTNITMENHHD